MIHGLSEQELREIETRCDLASPGPWISVVEGRDQVSGSSFIMTGPPERSAGDIELIGATADEQDFIAFARRDIPRLIAEIKILSTNQQTRDAIMTHEELDEIESRYGRVPPGPWTTIDRRALGANRVFVNLGPPATNGGEVEILGATRADLEFIAHVRDDVPQLVAEVKRLRALTSKNHG